MESLVKRKDQLQDVGDYYGQVGKKGLRKLNILYKYVMTKEAYNQYDQWKLKPVLITALINLCFRLSASSM